MTAVSPTERRADPAASLPIKVLIVAPSMSIIGGQSVQADFLLQRLQGEPSLEVAFEPINPILPPLLRPIQRVRYLRTLPTFTAFCINLYKAMRRCDIVHAFSASYFAFVLSATPAIILARLMRKPVILNYHSGEAEDHLARWPLAVRTLALADSIIVPSRYLVEVFARFGLRASVIPNAVDLAAFRYRARKPPGLKILANRNFEAHYNVACVLRAFARIQASRPDASLTVAGDGPERNALRKLATELALKHVRFLGRVLPAAMPALYDDHDIWLNASDIDNMPISILESFASGVAVVSTDAGGIPFMVEDGVNGRLVPRGDHEALARAALAVIDEPALFEVLTCNARAECDRYKWEVARRGWLSAYAELSRGPLQRHEDGSPPGKHP